MITLPSELTANCALKTVAICEEIVSSSNTADIDASQLRFMDPFSMAMLGACFDNATKDDVTVNVHNLSKALSGYLQRMDVFTGVNLVDCPPNNNQRHDRSNTLVELTKVRDHSAVGETAHRLALAIIGNAVSDEVPDEMTGYTTHDRLVEPLQYVLNELLENALTHARRGNKHACVWVASQHYRQTGRIRLGVVDNGCGFLGSLRGHSKLALPRNLDAILLALQPRVSCNRDLGLLIDSVNQGVGLTTACRIAERANGHMVLVSGDAMHNTSDRSEESDDAYWQGVGIAIEIQRSELVNVHYRELLPELGNIAPANLRFE